MSNTNIGQLQIALVFNNKEYNQSLKQAENSTKNFAQVARNAIISNVAQKAFSAVTGAVKDFASSIIETGMKFESSMSEVAAISGATGDELAMLEQTARDFGASTQFSASEAADALKYMSLAGWDANQSASALGGVLDLAAASGMELAAASDMVTDYLSAFGMEAEQSAYFADLLSYAQANSNTTAAALGEAYKNCAANLNAAGQDVETTTSLLAMMANQGLKGSEAGTALNAVMRDMTAKMKKGAIAIGNTSVQVMDANGNYRDMTDILTDVEAATADMGDAEKAAALSSTFTSDSIKGLNLIMNAGVKEAAAFEEELRNSEGTAKDMAAVMNDNLSGKMKELNSKFEELQLKIYDAVKPALEAGATALSGLADGFGWVIDNANIIIPILAGLVAAFVAYQIAVNASLIPTWLGVTALNALEAAQAALNFVMNLNPIGLIVAAIVALVAIVMVLWNNCEGFRNFIMGVIETISGAIGAVGEFIGGVFNRIGEIATTIFQTIWDFISPIVNLLVQVFQGWWNVVSTIFQAIWNIASTVFNVIWNIVSTIIGNIVTIFQNLWQIVSGVFNAVWNIAKSVFGTVWNIISTIIRNVVIIFQNLWQIISGIFHAVWSLVSSIFQNVWTTISGVINKIKMVFQGAWNFVTGIFGRVGGWFRDRFNEAFNAIKSVFSGIGSFFQGIWDKVTGIFKSVGTTIGNAVSGTFKAVVNGILSTVENILNGPIRAINGLISVINAIPGINLSHLSEFNLPRMAQGGIVPGTSYSGDHNMIMANSGEMVITRNQQAALWEMIESGNYGHSNESGENYTDNSQKVEIIQNNTIANGFDVEQMNQAMLAAMRGV